MTSDERRKAGGETHGEILDPSTAQPDAPKNAAKEKVGLLRSG